MFFRVHIFQGPYFSGSRFFRVQLLNGPGFSRSGSRILVLVFQGSGPDFRSSSGWLLLLNTQYYRFLIIKISSNIIEMALRELERTEAATGGVLWKKIFFKKLANHRKTPMLECCEIFCFCFWFFYVFLWNLRNFLRASISKNVCKWMLLKGRQLTGGDWWVWNIIVLISLIKE